MVVTEGWAPNAERARHLLRPRGVRVVETDDDGPLPFADDSFELVTARHPVRPDWAEIRRVLQPGGRYFAQHVGQGVQVRRRPRGGVHLPEDHGDGVAQAHPDTSTRWKVS